MADLSSLLPSKARLRETLITLVSVGGLAGVTKAQRVTDDSVRRRALEADLVSFDVFDTAIVRALAAPIDLFGFLGEPFVAFRDARLTAEAEARDGAGRIGRGEVTLGEIHDRAAWPTFGGVGESLVEQELALEHRFCRAHPPALDLFDQLKAAGRPPVFISDTSLDREQMVNLLTTCGFEGWSEVIVSSEYGRTKREGELFDIAAAQLGGPTSWLHIGDTLTPDVLSARRRGIRAAYVLRPIDQLRLIAPSLEHRLRESLPDIAIVSVVVGLLANAVALHDRPNVASLEAELEALASGLAEVSEGMTGRGLSADLRGLVALTPETRRALQVALTSLRLQ